MYKELTLMGLISFILFMVENLVPIYDESWLLSFEYAHMLIFFMAAIYVMQAAILITSVGKLHTKLERLNSDPNMAQDAFWGFHVFREW